MSGSYVYLRTVFLPVLEEVGLQAERLAEKFSVYHIRDTDIPEALDGEESTVSSSEARLGGRGDIC